VTLGAHLIEARGLTKRFGAFVAVDAPVVALTHARLVDGTGTPAKDDQTILITGDKITAVGKTASVTIPADARTIDLTGRNEQRIPTPSYASDPAWSPLLS